MPLFLSCLLVQSLLLIYSEPSFSAQDKDVVSDSVDESKPADDSFREQLGQAETQPKEIVNSIGMKLVLIPKGTFAMGSPETEDGRWENEVQHEVTLTKDFYLGVMEVTQAQYKKVMGENPSDFQGNEIKGDASLSLQLLSMSLSEPPDILQEMADRGELPGRKIGGHWRFERAEIIRWVVEGWFENPELFPEERLLDFQQLLDSAVKQATTDTSSHPVEQVSWDEAVEFCKRLSALPDEKKAGRVYRLPTEAEWEYACRAGSTTAFFFGNDTQSLSEYAWFDVNGDSQTHPVGSKKPNAWGLHDMHGNVWEWCSDWYGDYPKKPVSDPLGPIDGSDRVHRGGCCKTEAADCRSALRTAAPWSSYSSSNGFRLAISSPIVPKSASGLPQEAAKELVNSIDMKLVLIPKGTFMMGPESAEGRTERKTQHQVTLTNDFYLGVTEVTQAQYQKVMGENPSRFQNDKIKGDSSNHPVEKVSWLDAVDFCNRLSELPEEKKAGRVYRLPTEAEWEHACRAGSKTAYFFGDEAQSLSEYAWFGINGDSQTHPVGSKKPNAWGLYDMHGNVWEWCSDWYSDYPEKPVIDPTGPSKATDHVVRGGSYANEPTGCRSATWSCFRPKDRFLHLGFRVALSVPEN
jgi:formylglycine-generating enzyme required for sulfatase activity